MLLDQLGEVRPLERRDIDHARQEAQHPQLRIDLPDGAHPHPARCRMEDTRPCYEPPRIGESNVRPRPTSN